MTVARSPDSQPAILTRLPSRLMVTKSTVDVCARVGQLDYWRYNIISDVLYNNLFTDIPIDLGSLHDLVQSTLNSSDELCAGSKCTTAPDTPQRAPNPGRLTGHRCTVSWYIQDTFNLCPDPGYIVAPLTPLANLKVLMAAAAATSALEGREERGGVASAKEEVGVACVGKEEVRGACVGEEEGSTAGRKMKSLALLCKKFVFPRKSFRTAIPPFPGS